MLRVLVSRIRATLQRGRLDDEFDGEVREHLEMLEERFVRNGMTHGEAYYAARRQFGGVTQMKENLRERRALPPADVMVQDVRRAFRQLRKAKWFTAAAALTLALGIGASTAVFAVLNAVVLRPLPFADPDRLMAFRSIDRRGPHPTTLSYPNFFDFRRQNRVFEHLVCYTDSQFTLGDSKPPIRVAGEVVSWDLFAALGVQPALGRGFRAEEEAAGTHVVVLSHRLWRSRFAADPGIVGQPIRINGRMYTVTGVTPAGFQFPVEFPEVELWTTLSVDASVTEGTPMTEQRGARVLDVIGRLKPGVTRERAQAQMDQVAGALARQYPDDNGNVATTSVVPESARLTGPSRTPLLILLGAVGLVLLIACANVANLLVARGTERTREFALRSALGASRQAIIRQLLTESLVLGLVGCAGGVLLAEGAVRLALPLAGDRIPVPRLYQAGVDLKVLAFSAVLALLTAVLFSLAPAAQVVRADLAGALKEGASSIARGHHGLRSALVVGQVALGLVLLVGAEVLMAGFLYLAHRDPGFRTDHLLTFDVGLAGPQYDNAGQIAFSDRLLQRLRVIPGVRAAAAGMPLPLRGHEMGIAFDIEERPAPPAERPSSDMAIATPAYFHTMGIGLLRGRYFTEHDDANAPRVLIVNEAFARRYFPGEDAIGKRIEPGGSNIGEAQPMMREIVGIVRDAKQAPLTADPDPIYYFPYKQLSWDIGTIVLRTAIPPAEVAPAVRAALAGLDQEAPMYKIRTGEELSAAAIAGPRFFTALMSGFAAIALSLTVAGLYGVLSFSVARRRREIGVRIALGAGRRPVLGLVLREAMGLVVLGIMLGAAGGVGAERLLKNAAAGVRAGDPIFLAAACVIMVIASLAAAYLPAARAASVDPIQALRTE